VIKVKVRIKCRKITVTLLLAWFLIAGLASFLPARSQTTYTVEYFPIDDAYVSQDSPDNNYGLSTEIKISDHTPAYIKFDLSNFTLPVERIISAKLKLYVLGHSNTGVIKGYYVSDDTWSEETITYNNKPSYDSSIKCSSQDVSTDNVWIEMDIKDIIVQRLTQDDKILSLRFYRLYTVRVASKEYAEADKWPRLIIEYEPYTETTTQTITETITVTDTITETVTETQTVTDTVTTTETVIGGTTTVTETQTITETQTETITQTIIDTVYTTETVYTTQTETATQTITETVTNTATTTISQTTTEWATETITVTTTLTPTVTETVTPSYGNQTANYYTDLANQLVPLVMVIGVICSLLGLLLSATGGRR